MKIVDLNKQVEKDRPGITKLRRIKRIPFGIFQLDYCTGGGIPKGRVSTMYGPESCGKTNHALKLIAEYQSICKDHVVFMDVEHTFDMDWAVQFGVIPERITVPQPGTAEEAIDLSQAYMQTDDIGLMVIDSLTAVVSNKEVEKDGAWVNMAGNAILVQRLLMKLVNAQNEAMLGGRHITVLALNQLRANVGAMYGPAAGVRGSWYARHCMSMAIQLYAKDEIVKEVDPDLPAWKTTTVTMKKWKVPIKSKSFVYHMGVHPRVGIGYTDSANMLWAIGSNKQLIQGASGKYLCFGEPFKKKGDFMERLVADIQFRQQCEAAVIKVGVNNMIPAQAEKGQG